MFQKQCVFCLNDAIQCSLNNFAMFQKRRVSFADPIISGESPAHEATLSKVPGYFHKPDSARRLVSQCCYAHFNSTHGMWNYVLWSECCLLQASWRAHPNHFVGFIFSWLNHTTLAVLQDYKNTYFPMTLKGVQEFVLVMFHSLHCVNNITISFLQCKLSHTYTSAHIHTHRRALAHTHTDTNCLSTFLKKATKFLVRL